MVAGWLGKVWVVGGMVGVVGGLLGLEREQ